MLQKNSPQADDTARTIVGSSKSTSTTLPVNCWLNNQDIDHPASVNWHIRFSDHLQITGHTAPPMTYSENQDLHQILFTHYHQELLERWVYTFDITWTFYSSSMDSTKILHVSFVK